MMIRQVHVPRWSQLMRSASMPYLQRPHVTTIRPVLQPGITPWYEPGNVIPAGSLGAYELAESMEPRSNPAFNDTYVIGASGAAQYVVPQGLDYSRRPCCSNVGVLSGFADMLTTVPPLVFAAATAALAFGGLWVFMSKTKKKKKNPWVGGGHHTRFGRGMSPHERLISAAKAYVEKLRPGEAIDAEGLDRAIWPEQTELGSLRLGHYTALSILEQGVKSGQLRKDGKWYEKVSRNPFEGSVRTRAARTHNSRFDYIRPYSRSGYDSKKPRKIPEIDKANQYLDDLPVGQVITPQQLVDAIPNLMLNTATTVLWNRTYKGDVREIGNRVYEKIAKNPWRGPEVERLVAKANDYVWTMAPGQQITAETLAQSVPPEHDEYGEIPLSHYWANIVLHRHVGYKDLTMKGKPGHEVFTRI